MEHKSESIICVDTEDNVYSKYWMELLSDSIANKRLVDVLIPASHNSTTDS